MRALERPGCLSPLGIAVSTQRCGEVELVSPIPADVAALIERLHRSAGESSRDPLKRGLLALLDGFFDTGGWQRLPGGGPLPRDETAAPPG